MYNRRWADEDEENDSGDSGDSGGGDIGVSMGAGTTGGAAGSWWGGANYRPPPEALARTQQAQTNSWCRYDPGVCAAQIGIEAVFLAASYCSLMFLTGGSPPGPFSVLRFLAFFFVLSLTARMISDDLGNKLSFSAASGVASKCVSVLAPRFVGW